MASVESWMGEIAEIGPVYPFQGSEGLWVLVCLGFWIWWHMAQMRTETLEHNEIIENLGDEEDLLESLYQEQDE